MKKERLKIGIIYLSISAIFVILCLWLVLGIWYAGVMPALFGLSKILSIFVIVNIVIFPLLSVLICKKDKREQKRDLTIIAILQIIISGMMLYFINYSRPVWISFPVDSFEIVRKKDVQPDEEASPLAKTNIFQPYHILGASFSKDPEIAKKQRTNDLFGLSIAWYPSAVVPLSEKIDQLKKHALPLSELKKYNPAEEVAAVLKKYPEATSYFPLKGFVKDGTVLTNKNFTWFQPVDLLPWENDYLDPHEGENSSQSSKDKK